MFASFASNCEEIGFVKRKFKVKTSNEKSNKITKRLICAIGGDYLKLRMKLIEVTLVSSCFMGLSD